MDLFLDVEGWSLDEEVFLILFVFTPPDELRIQVAISSFVVEGDGALYVFGHDGLVFGGRDVTALVA